MLYFFIAIVPFIAAVFNTGDDAGTVLWRPGVAAILLEMLCVLLWPKSNQG